MAGRQLAGRRRNGPAFRGRARRSRPSLSWRPRRATSCTTNARTWPQLVRSWPPRRSRRPILRRARRATPVRVVLARQIRAAARPAGPVGMRPMLVVTDTTAPRCSRTEFLHGTENWGSTMGASGCAELHPTAPNGTQLHPPRPGDLRFPRSESVQPPAEDRSGHSLGAWAARAIRSWLTAVLPGASPYVDSYPPHRPSPAPSL